MRSMSEAQLAKTKIISRRTKNKNKQIRLSRDPTSTTLRPRSTKHVATRPSSGCELQLKPTGMLIHYLGFKLPVRNTTVVTDSEYNV